MGEESVKFIFQPAQWLGPPSPFPPPAEGRLPAAVRFVIPGLHIGAGKDRFVALARKCSTQIWDVGLDEATNQRTGDPATLVTLAFYLTAVASDAENVQALQTTSRILAERYLGLLSFCAGMKLSAAHQQATVLGREGHYHTILGPVRRTSTPRTRITLPGQLLSGQMPSEAVFSALFWLRRGLAERDPLETFSSLMVCLQVLAREIVQLEPVAARCANCGAELADSGPSVSSLVRELVVSKLGAPDDLFEKLWKARNAVTAHGNRAVTAEVFLELTMLKFDAAVLAFKGVKLALRMPIDDRPMPQQAFFVTDAFMHLD